MPPGAFSRIYGKVQYMRKITRLLSLALLLVTIPLPGSVPARADVLKPGSIIRQNLNGDGKTEQIRYTETISGKKAKKTSTLDIYINKKLRTTISETAMDVISSQVSLIDFNENKPYIDIYVEFHQMDDAFVSGHAYRYYSSKKFKVLYETTSSVVSYTARLGKQKKDGTACYTTTYSDPYVGMVDVHKFYGIRKQTLFAKSGPVYTTTKEHRNKLYKARMSLDVFTNRTDKKAAFTIKKGDVFTIEKIFTTDQFAISYIQIRTSDKKIGWIPTPKKSFYKMYDSYDEKFVNGIYEW